jgi:hypothetical protein
MLLRLAVSSAKILHVPCVESMELQRRLRRARENRV